MKIVPQNLYNSKHIQVLSQDGQSCILYKDIKLPHANQEAYISSHVLTIIIKGEKRVSTYDGEVITIHDNEMAFLPKDLYVVSDFSPAYSTFKSFLFFFDDSIIDEFLSAKQWVHPSNGYTIDKAYKADYSQIIQVYTGSLGPLFTKIHQDSKDLLRLKLLELLQLIAMSDSSQTFVHWLTSINDKKKRNLLDFMGQNFDKPLRVEDYAHLTGRSLSSFQRDFKKQFNQSPIQWLIDKRLEKAYQLLSSRNLTVTDVAYEVGYENISHFIKAFKQRYQQSPKQFFLQQETRV